MRVASVYRRGDDILIHPSSRTTAGAWIMSEPVTRLDAACSDEALGAAVRAALGSSREGVPHPAVWVGFFDPVLKLAKTRSWAAFVRGARLVGVEQEAGRIRLTSTRNVGSREGFEDDPSGAAVVEEGAPSSVLGAAARAALLRAR